MVECERILDMDSTPARRTTYADLERMPDDGQRYELYDGEVRVVPSPLPVHQVVALNIWELLREHARAEGGLAAVAPLDIVFSEYDVLQPDVVLLGPAKRRAIRLDAPIRMAPDIAVEVLSPSTAVVDRGRKMATFARYGVPEYWLVDPAARTLQILTLREGRYQEVVRDRAGELRSPVLHDVVIPIDRVFEFP